MGGEAHSVPKSVQQEAEVTRDMCAVLKLSACVWAAGLLDAATTYAGILGAGAVELNPIQHAIGWPAFWIGKATMMVLMTAYLIIGTYAFPRFASIYRVLALAAVLMGSIAPLNNLLQIANATWR